MQVVLTKDVAPLGKKGQFKTVKNGYFRNFLAPRGLALRLTPKFMKQLSEQQKRLEKRHAEMIERASEFKEKIEALALSFSRKTTSKNKLYAAITEKQIQDALEKELKIQFGKEVIVLSSPIKALGEHEATVVLSEDVSAPLKIVVDADAES